MTRAPGATLLVLDAGTASVRAALVDSRLHIVRLAQRGIGLSRPAEGHAEQDGAQIIARLRETIAEVLADGQQPLAASLVTQRSTVIAWDSRSSQPLSPALSWQDTRADAFVESLQPHARRIKALSGLVPSAHYGAGKLRWLRREPGSDEHVHAAPLVSFLLAGLLEGAPFLCDESNAARTQLFDIHRRCWSRELCSLFQVNPDTLPRVLPVHAAYGRLAGTQIPVQTVCGDQLAAFRYLRHCGAHDATAAGNSVYINIGTGAFMLRESQAPAMDSPLLNGRTDNDDAYLLEGTVNGAGAALEWLYNKNSIPRAGTALVRRNLGEDECRARPDFDKQLPQALAADLDPPLFLNSIGGLGSPFWSSTISPAFVQADGKPAVLEPLQAQAKAVLESIAFLLRYNLDLMEKAAGPIDRVVAGGGLLRIEGFAGLLADALQKPVAVVQETEATVLGAALLLGAGTAASEPLTVTEPRESAALQARRERLYELLQARAAEAEHARPAPWHIVGHRGLPARYPENTLQGFAAAVRAGADAVEFDVHLSRDGVPVVIHDATLERTSDARGRVAAFTWNELAGISCHYPEKFGERFKPEPLPSLEAACTLLRQWPVTVCIELKRKALAQGREFFLRQVLQASDVLGDKRILLSFDHDILALAATLCPLRTGWCLEDYGADTRSRAQTLQPALLAASAELIGAAALWPGPWDWFIYDIDDAAEARQWLERGAVWIETDDAAAIADALRTAAPEETHGQPRT